MKLNRICFALALASFAEAGPIGPGTLYLTGNYRDGHPGDMAATAAGIFGSINGEAACTDIALVTNPPTLLTGVFDSITSFNDAVKARLFTEMLSQTGGTVLYQLALWSIDAPTLTPHNPISAALKSNAILYVTALSGNYSEFSDVSYFHPDQKWNQSFLFAGTSTTQDNDAPEPATMAVAGVGLILVALRKRRR